MGDRLAEIRWALDRFQMDEARDLVADELAENPGAEAYYLAAQAALNHGQRVEYLERALELDPTYQDALAELAEIRPAAEVAPEMEAGPANARAAPQPQVKLASLPRRFFAVVIDGFVVAIFSVALMVVNGSFGQLYEAMAGFDEGVVAAAMAQFQSDAVPVNLVVSAVYNVVLLTMFNGQTLGKMALGLRVIKKNGRRISVLDAFVRNVFGYTISQIFMLGYVWAALDRERQAWHDKMAGTVVVLEGRR